MRGWGRPLPEGDSEDSGWTAAAACPAGGASGGRTPSSRHLAQVPLKDVPFIIEGPSGPRRLLKARLQLFRQKRTLIPDAPGEAYSWTDLIPLNDELFILAFRDESMLNIDDPHA